MDLYFIQVFFIILFYVFIYNLDIATVNLGCHTVLNLYKKSLYDQVTSTTPSFSIFLPPRSLLILKGEIYENYLHGIEEISTDLLSPSSIINWEMRDSEEIVKERESTRVSLTFRVAKKVSKLSFLNFK
jgi:alkylated DNA repair protein alkB homolog 6